KAMAGERDVLFDPFHGGRRLTPEECEQLVQRVTGERFPVGKEQLKAVPPGLILQRLLNNLKAIYLQAEDFPRAIRIIQRLTQLAPRDPVLRRDLGASLLRAG